MVREDIDRPVVPVYWLFCHLSCDIILTSLGSDQAVLDVYAELFAGQESQDDKGNGIVPGGRGKSTIYVDTSTVRCLLA